MSSDEKAIYAAINVAILVYDEVYLLDFAGPLEVFFDANMANNSKLFNVYTVSPKKEFKVHTGSINIADYDLKNCPKPTILIVPGGNLNLIEQYPDIKNWLKETSKEAKTIMSVCTGAFILADLGFLDNINATTWHGATDNLKKRAPKVNIQKGARYTDSGKIITTAGISAGIDGSLYVVSKYYGDSTAYSTAKYMEYDFKK